MMSVVSVNRDKPDRWKADIAASVDMYNEWFINFAPAAYRATRQEATAQVEATLHATSNLARIDSALLKQQPDTLPVLRMATCPPLAVDRLIGLASVPTNLVKNMERGRLPPRMPEVDINRHLNQIANTLTKMVDVDVFPWLDHPKTPRAPSARDRFRAATVVADRLCGSIANPLWFAMLKNNDSLRRLVIGSIVEDISMQMAGPHLTRYNLECMPFA